MLSAGLSTLVVALLLLLLPLNTFGEVSFRVCEDSKQEQVLGGSRSQVQLVYNQNRHEYFSVHILVEDEKTSVMGQRFDERGSPLNKPIPIFPWVAGQTISKNTKRDPVVAYNNNTDNYLVAWEFDFYGTGQDWDVVARVVSGAGTPQGPGPFFIAASVGRDDSPHLAFSPVDNAFLLVHEVDDSRSGVRGISVERLNETHKLAGPIILNTSSHDREPFVAYHPPSNDFMLVWEFDANHDNKSEIGAVVVGGTPLKAKSTTPAVVGTTIEEIGGVRTSAHDHDAQLVYSPTRDVFLLAWEVDGDSGEKEVVCNLVSPEARASSNFQVVGNASHPYDRKPSAVYSPFSDEFFIAYETGPNANAAQIAGAAFRGQDLHADVPAFVVSQQKGEREHAPVVALSSTCGDILALWEQGGASSSSSSSSSSSGARTAASVGERALEQAPPPPAGGGGGRGSAFVVAEKHEQTSALAQPRDGGSILTVSVPRDGSRLPPSEKLASLPGGWAPSAAAASRPVEEEQQQQEQQQGSAVPHIHMLLLPLSSLESPERRSSTPSSSAASSSLQAARVCLPGRGSCSAAGSPLPLPSGQPSSGGGDGGGGSSAVGIVLGLLGAVVALGGLAVGGYVAWRRFPQIRERWESFRGRGAAAFGAWADESEFSISVDAFSNEEAATDDDDKH